MARLSLSLLAALLVAGALAATAQAAAPVKFRVQIQASQTTTWKQPYHETANNCFNRPWIRGEGGETLKFRGSGIAYVHRVGGAPILTYGSPEFGPSGKPGIVLRATNERRRHSERGNMPGPCGGGTPAVVEQATCGSRSARVFAQLSWARDRRRLELRATGDTSALRFPHCLLWKPEGVEDGWLTTISQRAPAREILDPDFRRHIVIARKTFRRVLYPDAATITMTTGVHWQVTLTRLSR